MLYEVITFGTRLAKYGMVGSKAQVTNYMQYVSSSNGITVYHGNHRFGQGTYQFLHIEDVQSGYPVFADIAGCAFNILVATAASYNFV